LSARVASLKYAAQCHFVQTRGSYRLQNGGYTQISLAKSTCVKTCVTPGSRANRTLLPVAPTGVAMPPRTAGFGNRDRFELNGKMDCARRQDNSAS
jgi:hypothetical protein